ncbi:MAG: cell division protein FtsZ [Azospirillum brasilense]|nr:MAG: cell division protein FtsZ [Azospirillum brasilense]
MTINLHLPSEMETLRPKITVVGVGGAGGNAVNNMIAASLEGIDFVIANTDAQALDSARTDRVIQLGVNVTRGLGAGAKPEVGYAAAEEAVDEIADSIAGSNMVFITAGMGGGTGTGAAPVVARLAKEQGMLTVGVVTKPFQFEGAHRMRMAEAGIRELQQYVDTLIVVPNQNLFRIANEKTTFAEAFRLADEVLHSGVRGVTDLIVKPGMVNLDFADIRAVMSEMGKAMMGTGEATGDSRALQAAEAAISNPLLDDVSLKGARAVLVNITGGMDLSLYEVDEAVNRIRDEVDADANIIFGSTFSDSMEGKMRVSVVATGIDAAELQNRPTQPEFTQAPRPQSRAPFSIGAAAQQAPVRKEAPVAAAPRAVAPQPVAAPRAAAPQAPVIRIIDEAAQAQEDAARAAAHQQQVAAMNAQAAQLEQAMRLAAAPQQARPVAAAAAAPAQAAMAEAGPLFVSPRAEQPVQRTLFAAQSPEMEEEEYDDASAGGKNIFGRLANVGKALASGRVEPRGREELSPRKAEVREVAAQGQDEEEFYDIPAFLRRQAN